MATSSISVVDGAVSHVNECGLEVALVEEIPPARTQASVSKTGREAIECDGSESVEQAIDRAAMKSGAAESDAYLEGFRKADPYPVEGEDAQVAAAEVARIEAEYDQERIKTLIANDGWA